MLFFHGICRKAAIVPLTALLVGWVVYLVGFGLFIHQQDDSNRNTINNLPLYLAVATPLPLVILAGVHAALSGIPSSIFGLLSAILSVVFVTSTGYVLYGCAQTLYIYVNYPDSDSLDVNCVLMFTGSFLSCLSWVSILVMWQGYIYTPHQNYYNLDEIDEDGTINSPRPLPKTSALFLGITRKLAVLFLVLETGSWCVLVKGVNDEIRNNNLSSPFFQELAYEAALPFDIWVGSVVGAILVISALFHAAKSSALMGTLVSLLSVLFLVCTGSLVFGMATELNFIHKNGIKFQDYQMYQLGGGVGCCIFWACVVALWPFYSVGGNGRHANGTLRHRQGREYLYGNEDRENMPLLYQSNEHKAAPSL